jgi:hypothetical protein
MTTPGRKRTLGVLGRTAVVALFLIGIILSGRFADFWDGAGFIFVIGGAIALTLLGFSLSQIGAAARYIAGWPLREEDDVLRSDFWEALGRNFWVLGVLASVINFVLNLVQAQGGIQEMTFRLAVSFRPAIYGLVLGIFCGLPALKLSLTASPSKRPDQPARSNQSHPKTVSLSRIESGVGLLLMIAILFGTIVFRLQQNPTRNFAPLDFFLDWPAVLVVAGGTVVLTMLLGPRAWGASITLAGAVTGFVGAIVGFLRVMLAVSHANISNVAGSIAFIISSCFLALVIMVLVGIPLSDWERRFSHPAIASPLIRLSWYVFPFLVLIFLVLAFILVVTPFQKPA